MNIFLHNVIQYIIIAISKSQISMEIAFFPECPNTILSKHKICFIYKKIKK